ncbi:hypothetical protein AB0J14_28145 [Micromonospora arborensis]|uniref:hypothetical protein n=1 Tax=Micromonospora arborensis TaxID=2116518 RepID=UPI0033DBBAF1
MITDPPLATAPAADPFTSLAVHYGMLLGVSDFQVLAANPRGKLQLHQAWQHGKGVVWGYGVDVAEDEPTLRVGPGLAVDGLGREVYSSAPMCLNVHDWLEEQVKEHALRPGGNADRKTFDARLVLRYANCLSRPVPSIGDTCGQATGAVEHSRVLEFAHLELRPYEPRDPGAPLPSDERDKVFEPLRALVRDRLWPDGKPVPPDGLLRAFRTVAAQVGAGLGPPGLVPRLSERTRLYPEDEPGEILLTNLPGLALVRVGDGWRLDAPTIDLSVRRAHLPTWVIEELIAELLAGSVGRRPVEHAHGPRVIRVQRAGEQVTVELTRDVVEGSVAQALEVHAFDTAAAQPKWGPRLKLTPTVTRQHTVQPPTPARIEFTLPTAPTSTRSYRLVLRGTGPTPLVGLVDRRPVPLAGRVGDPAAPAAHGHDVVEILDEGVRQ